MFIRLYTGGRTGERKDGYDILISEFSIGGNIMRLLFVCTGNTCRSPMAEALVKHKIPEVEVQSAGIFAANDQQANPKTIEVLKQKQIKMNHLSQPVTKDLLHWADVVLTMTTQHKQSLIMSFPQFQDKYFTLKEYVLEADKEVWEKLKKAYADYEEKRSIFIQKHQHKLDNSLLNQRIQEHLAEDMVNIRRLEANLINYDISDPFGGDLRTYQDTLDELDKYIDLLRKKLTK